MTVSYEQARAWAEDRLSFWEEWASGHEDGDDCPQGHSVIWQERATRTRADIAALRALIAGPPEPSEEEVARVIDPRAWERLDVERKHYPADPLERFTTVPDVAVSIMRAQAVLALFRSRING